MTNKDILHINNASNNKTLHRYNTYTMNMHYLSFMFQYTMDFIVNVTLQSVGINDYLLGVKNQL